MPKKKDFSGEKVLSKMKIVLAKTKIVLVKIKKYLQMKKVLVFLSRIFRFFLFKNAPQALPMRCRRSKMAPQVKFLKNMHKTLIFQEKKYLQKIKIVLAKNKKNNLQMQKSTCFSLWNFWFFPPKTRRKRSSCAVGAQKWRRRRYG